MKVLRALADVLRQWKVTTLLVVVALTLGVVSSAFAANGQNFIIGNGLTDTIKNIATLPTKLTMRGTATGPARQVTQQSTNTGAAGIGVTVPTGKAPLKVNATAGKATNLNADKLDNIDSLNFWRGTYYIVTFTNFAPGTANATSSYGITCEPGDSVLSGGYTVDTAGGTPTIIKNAGDIGILAEGDNGYVMSWKNGATVANIKLFVQCADLGTPLGATATGAGA
jgi:hypothetical protein